MVVAEGSLWKKETKTISEVQYTPTCKVIKCLFLMNIHVAIKLIMAVIIVRMFWNHLILQQKQQREIQCQTIP